MKQKIFLKLFLILTFLFTIFSCSNFFGLTLAERQELNIKDKPPLTVQRLPSILPCERVDDHYEVEVLVIPERNLRFPKPTDEYILNFDAYVTNEVKITGIKAISDTMPFLSFDFSIDVPITSKNGRINVTHEIVFPEDMPNLRLALRNLRFVAIVETEATDGVTFILIDAAREHITSDNVEIEYYTPYNPPVVGLGQVALTFKNVDGSVFATIVGNIGDEVTLPEGIPVWYGHVFVKWRDVPKVFPQSSAEYEAVWELETYYIDYELNGGVNSRGNVDFYTVDDEALKLYPPTKADSVFCGWYIDPDFKNSVSVVLTSRAEDIKLYARWLETAIGQITLYAATPVVVGGQQGKILSYLKMPDGSMPALEWSCETPGLASVNSDGTVFTNVVPFNSKNPVASIQEVVITARYSNLMASCKIKVIPTTLTKEILQYVWPEVDTLSEFTIPYGIETIGFMTFYRSELKNVVLPETLKIIEGNAFAHSSITTEIPDSVTYIGDSAFRGCFNLKTPKFPKNLKYLGAYAFSNCNFTGPIVIYGNNTRIPSYAFYNCKNLEGVTFKSGVESIGFSAFEGCGALREVKIEEGLKVVGPYAFQDCGSLKTLELADSITRIDNSAFCVSDRQGNITGPLKLPKNLEFLGDYAFYGQKQLKGPIEFSKTLKNIGEWAFGECSSLTGTVTIPSGVKEINKCAFYKCSSLEGVKFEEGVESIGEYAFEYCSSLKGPLVLPKSLKTIDNYAFYDCSSIKEVKIYANGSLESVAPTAFTKSVFTVTLSNIPSNYDAERWNKNILYGFRNLVELKIENSPGYAVVNASYNGITTSALYSADKTKLVYVPRCSVTDIDTSDNTPRFKIPDSVTHIGDYALYGWGSDISTYRISWPDNCKIVSYGDYCFGGGGWRSMTIVNTAKFVGKGFIEGSALSEGVKFINTSGWYYTTNPNYTGGTSVNVSNITTNATNLKTGGAWADGYLYRN